MTDAVKATTTRHQLSAESRPALLHDVPLPGLTVVVFIVAANRPPNSAGQYVRQHDGFELMPMLFHSVRRLHRRARFAIVTSPTTDIPTMRYPVEIFRRPINPGPLLYERMRLYIEYLEQAPADRTYLFLESDMLMLAPLRLPEVGDWDAAIAYKHDGMLINSGMLLVRANRRDAAVRFLRRTLEVYGSRHVDDARWGADQAAYRDALGITEPPSQASVIDVDSARVLVILRDNYTKFARTRMKTWQSLALPPTWILHFSGRRKKNMRYFYWWHMGRGALLGRLISLVFGRQDYV